MKKLLFKILLMFVVIISPEIFSQYGSIGSVDARSMGLAKTYTTVTQGIYSIGLNPANLAFNSDATVQFATVLPLPTVSVRGGTNFISFEDISYYFGSDDGESNVLDDGEKDRLYSLFENGGSVFATANVQLFSFGISPGKEVGSFAFTTTDYSGGKAFVPEAIADFLLNGIPPGKVFDLSQTEFSSWWIRNYALTYAREFPELSGSFIEGVAFGISAKLIHGFAYIGTEEVSTKFSTSDQNIISGETNMLAYSSFSENFGIEYEFDEESKESNLSPFPKPAGSGYGLDVGFSFKLDDRWNMALAVTDLGVIEWRRNAAQFLSEGSLIVDDIFDKAQRDSVIDLLMGTASPVKSFSTELATAVRFGTSFLVSSIDEDDFPGSLLLALDYNQGLNNLPGNSLIPRFSIGAEWKPADYIPYIRTGFEILGVDGFNWAFGFGFDAKIVEFHIATSSMQTLVLPMPSNRVSVSLSSRWKF